MGRSYYHRLLPPVHSASANRGDSDAGCQLIGLALWEGSQTVYTGGLPDKGPGPPMERNAESGVIGKEGKDMK